MKDSVNLPFPGQRESYCEGQDDLFHLEGAMILVVQLPGGSARFDVAPVEHHQVSDLVFRRLGTLGICVAAHSFVCYIQPFGGCLVYCMRPVGVELAGGVQGSRSSWIRGHGMESAVSIERRHPIAHGNRIVVGKLLHREYAYPVVLLVADKSAEVCFDCLVETFCLPVGLGVEGR